MSHRMYRWSDSVSDPVITASNRSPCARSAGNQKSHRLWTRRCVARRCEPSPCLKPKGPAPPPIPPTPGPARLIRGNPNPPTLN